MSAMSAKKPPVKQTPTKSEKKSTFKSSETKVRPVVVKHMLPPSPSQSIITSAQVSVSERNEWLESPAPHTRLQQVPLGGPSPQLLMTPTPVQPVGGLSRTPAATHSRELLE